MKREFLVENHNVQDYLQKSSLTCKLYKYKDKNSYMYEFDGFSYVLEEYKSFKKLVLISEESVVLDETVEKLKEITDDIDETVEKLKEITDDKRYSKEYLNLFGDPKSNEFDEKRVFEKCDNAGLFRLDLHFKDGMSSAKVFRIILYRLNQIFTLEYEKYIKKEIDYDVLETSHQKLLKALKFSKKIFYTVTIEQLKDDCEDLYMLLNHQETFERYVLNFQMFIHEKSFYNTNEAEKPIHFFDKKEKLFKLI